MPFSPLRSPVEGPTNSRSVGYIEITARDANKFKVWLLIGTILWIKLRKVLADQVAQAQRHIACVECLIDCFLVILVHFVIGYTGFAIRVFGELSLTACRQASPRITGHINFGTPLATNALRVINIRE